MELLLLPYQYPKKKIPAVYRANVKIMPKQMPTISTECLSVDLYRSTVSALATLSHLSINGGLDTVGWKVCVFGPVNVQGPIIS